MASTRTLTKKKAGKSVKKATGNTTKKSVKKATKKSVKKAMKPRAKTSRKSAAKTTRKAAARTSRKASHKPSRKTKLTGRELTRFEKKLLEEKRRVLEEMSELQNTNLHQSISDQSGEVSRYSYHLGDTASLSYGREFSMGLAERQQKYLEQVEEALQRIKDGTYGICRVTGELIPFERLDEVPVAKYSVKGKLFLHGKKR